MMTRRLLTLVAGAALVAVLVAGCGGAGLIGALLTLIQNGDVVAQVNDILGGDEPEQFVVLLDGQPLPVTPDDNGDLELNGLPEGGHLLQIVAPNNFRGGVALINVEADTRVNVPAIPAVIGGRILGKVQLDNGAGGLSPARRVLVVALPGGATLVSGAGSPVAVPPTTTYYAGYTDANGDYALNAVEVGDYLVTAAVAGYQADARLVTIPAARRTLRADLALVRQINSPSGPATGTVRGELLNGSVSLGNARVTATPPQPFQPQVPQTVIDTIAAASGQTLRPSPWFAWTQLSTLSDAGGSYDIRSLPGTNRLACFAYDYKPGYRDVNFINTALIYIDLSLRPR